MTRVQIVAASARNGAKRDSRVLDLACIDSAGSRYVASMTYHRVYEEAVGKMLQRLSPVGCPPVAAIPCTTA